MSDLVGKKLVSGVLRWLVLGLFVLTPGLMAAEVPSLVSGLDLVSGKNFFHRLSEANRSTVLVFLSTRCPCSASHQPALNQIAEEFGPKGIQLIGVHSNANESLDEAKQFFSQSKFSFPVIQDSGSVLADQLGAFKTPHVFVLNPKSEIVFQGGVDNSKLFEKATRHFLRDALGEVVQGRAPKEQNVRVIGCQIQRP